MLELVFVHLNVDFLPFISGLNCILKIYLFIYLSLSFLSVSDFTLLTGAVLRTSIPVMEEVISNFPGKIN